MLQLILYFLRIYSIVSFLTFIVFLIGLSKFNKPELKVTIDFKEKFEITLIVLSFISWFIK